MAKTPAHLPEAHELRHHVMRAWTGWAIERGVTTFPARPADVAAFLTTTRADFGDAVAVAARAVLNDVHLDAGLTQPMPLQSDAREAGCLCGHGLKAGFAGTGLHRRPLSAMNGSPWVGIRCPGRETPSTASCALCGALAVQSR